jgi:hypothetical protein
LIKTLSGLAEGNARRWKDTMKRFTGEIFRMTNGRLALILDEQAVRIQTGEYILVDQREYRITGIVSQTRPASKWAVLIEEVLCEEK